MATARIDVANKLNEHALDAAKLLVNIVLGKETGGDMHIRMGAAKLILNKVVPDLRAVEVAMDDVQVKHTIEFK
jgi:hypothetical protein